MKWLKELYSRTIKIATMYTGTFVVIMILNQLLFFGFCLNPVCLIAAMPHVLFLTVIVGSWLNKEENWGKEKKQNDLTVIDRNARLKRIEKIGESNNARYIDESAKIIGQHDTHKPKHEVVPTPYIQLCPKCGEKMVIRMARQGSYTGKQFWGCSQYPKCRGIVNIDS